MSGVAFYREKGPGIIDFLMARLDEDETAARYEMEHDADHDVTRWGPDRVLVECDAKRAMVAELARLSNKENVNILTMVKLLVLPYADHPDFREEWRP